MNFPHTYWVPCPTSWLELLLHSSLHSLNSKTNCCHQVHIQGAFCKSQLRRRGPPTHVLARVDPWGLLSLPCCLERLDDAR
jgi:hypothetical protein